MNQFTLMLNGIYNKQIYPENWKKIKAIPILKKNQHPNEIKSFRPICLIDVTANIFNKLIKNRIGKHMEENNLYTQKQ